MTRRRRPGTLVRVDLTATRSTGPLTARHGAAPLRALPGHSAGSAGIDGTRPGRPARLLTAHMTRRRRPGALVHVGLTATRSSGPLTAQRGATSLRTLPGSARIDGTRPGRRSPGRPAGLLTADRLPRGALPGL
ncbi:hypothetical protein [Streptomyces sp. MAR4 CNX-425]|uniref:hypothetical protein n=1 Tax=Streptomyces sp. MAR4 CNX-425 TaxID=3406343 RepID=UPI003B5005C5